MCLCRLEVLENSYWSVCIISNGWEGVVNVKMMTKLGLRCERVDFLSPLSRTDWNRRCNMCRETHIVGSRVEILMTYEIDTKEGSVHCADSEMALSSIRRAFRNPRERIVDSWVLKQTDVHCVVQTTRYGTKSAWWR